jgi:hypothetical protein
MRRGRAMGDTGSGFGDGIRTTSPPPPSLLREPLRRRQMGERRFIELGVKNFSSGVDFTVTRKGVYVGGWYDGFVGIEGRLIPWAEIDEARRLVQSSEPLTPRAGTPQ